MKQTAIILQLLFTMGSYQLFGAPTTLSRTVVSNEIYDGYVVEKVWLSAYTKPQISLSDITFTTTEPLPDGIKTSEPEQFTVTMGMERKRPFALVRIPAYSKQADGSIRQMTSYQMAVTEQAAQAAPAARTTADVTTSVLASGTWYKIGIPTTGVYKIDQALLTRMGLNPASVNPANVRVYGNGGNMLSEANAVPRPTDLLENATQLVNDNGNGSFDNTEAVTFYAVGPTRWIPDSVNKRFTHEKNIYADTAFYFVTVDKGTGTRIASQGSVGTPNAIVKTFDYYTVHDEDIMNPATIGKIWYGERFHPQLGNTTQTFTFDLGVGVPEVHAAISFAGTGGGAYSASVNGNSIGTFPLGGTAAGANIISIVDGSGTVPCNAQSANVRIAFSPSTASSVGYLNYIELNARRSLVLTGDQMNFRDWQTKGAGNIARYELQGATASTQVWDVTNPQQPVQMNGSLSGSTYTFDQDASALHEFVAVSSSQLAPTYVGKVANQDLHGTGLVDYIIVAHPSYLDQAKRLAAYHSQHDGMRTVVATTQQVYNEFSSGSQDISAIRDFARMYYKRAGTDTANMPKYLLLFGGASYDYKDRVNDNTNFVPVFESAESQHDIRSYSTDDFFGILDDNENMESIAVVNTLDIGVGRLPARSVDDAKVMVDKIISYRNAATLGPWRVAATIVADNSCESGRPDPAGDHMNGAEQVAANISATGQNLYNEQKIYLDAIPIISTPAGTRSPNASTAINDNVYKGTFIINYNGHGSTAVWAGERILTQDDYSKWNNANMLPFMVTATCDFGQFDHPEYVSAAEQLVLHRNGGVIVVLTTTKAVYDHYNREINGQYIKAQFTQNADGSWNSFGEAARQGKNATYATSQDTDKLANFRKFALLGDPALTPVFPEYSIKMDSVTDESTQERADTIKALGAYKMDGSVRAHDGNILTSFNGILSVSFYDKPRSVSTLTGCNKIFKTQDNLVYKGKVSVVNGKFSFTFITPKDINYYYGTGKISLYAHNGITDAAGSDTGMAVGGFSDNPRYNTVPPVVRPFINDSLFQNGGITGSNTSLFVSLTTETGINVSGNNVGHDLTAILDDNVESPYLLNDYYETAPNTYKRGSVSFPLAGLPEGRHTIRVKAWDVNNNTGEGTVDFVVVNGQVMQIDNLGNYPNPFTNSTRFVFEHNHPDEPLNAQIAIYDPSGRIVKFIDHNFSPSGSRTNELEWDGTGDNGARLPSGLYVYRLSLTTESGFKSTAYQKLVIVR